MTISNCLYCGGRGKLLIRSSLKKYRKIDLYQVKCNKCHARGPISDSEVNAIRHWNGKGYPSS
nr:MAG TPA: restriction alleviation protein [Siphoviridae sp. ctFjF5]DAU57449.1 MAG TPA: restriction alleviation protein [Caudoviricetes sp.]